MRRGPAAAALVLVAGLLAGGCAGARRLEVPPGHRMVVGRVDLGRFDSSQVVLVLAREDGTYRHDLHVVRAAPDVVVALPPGRYRIPRIRLADDQRTLKSPEHFDVRIEFVVGPEPTTYVGTLRLHSAFQAKLDLSVDDEEEATVPALRARHPAIQAPVGRSLFAVR